MYDNQAFYTPATDGTQQYLTTTNPNPARLLELPATHGHLILHLPEVLAGLRPTAVDGRPRYKLKAGYTDTGRFALDLTPADNSAATAGIEVGPALTELLRASGWMPPGDKEQFEAKASWAGSVALSHNCGLIDTFSDPTLQELNDAASRHLADEHYAPGDGETR